MSKTIRVSVLIWTLFLMGTIMVAGQENNSTSSPYSRYGVGALNNYSFGRSDAMGGIGFGVRDARQINFSNPAAYTAIDSMAFLMEFGANSKHTIYEMGDIKNSSNDANFSYMSFSFPINRDVAVAFGVVPFSNRGYEISDIQEINDISIATNYVGTGTLTKVFLGTGINVNENLSLGVNGWFMFGDVSANLYEGFPGDLSAYDFSEEMTLQISDFGFSLGVQYFKETENKNKWVFGAVWEPALDLSSKYTIHQERSLFRGTSAEVIDTLTHIENEENSTTLPTGLGAGLSYTLKDKLTLGVDYYYQKWKDASFLGGTPDYLKNRERFSSGVEYIPNPFSIKSYWERVKYRGGFFYEKSYLNFDDQNIDQWGVTFGLGLPLNRSRSTLNLAAELGRMGTMKSDLVRESYVKLSVQVSLQDRWFVKRKFD